MPKKVKAITTLTGIRDDGKIMPNAAIWTIENTGTVPMKLNNSYTIAPGGRFGVDLSAIAAGGWDIEQTTEYEIKFNGSASNDASATRGATLFQTFITIE